MEIKGRGQESEGAKLLGLGNVELLKLARLYPGEAARGKPMTFAKSYVARPRAMQNFSVLAMLELPEARNVSSLADKGGGVFTCLDAPAPLLLVITTLVRVNPVERSPRNRTQLSLALIMLHSISPG